ncbi:MAG: Clp protease ClpP [Bacteroidales bacterium]|nr:Clp protease ClpP [Candidatus Scybalousia scybalohippi]
MKNSLNFKCEGNAIEIKMYGSIGERWWKDEDDDNIYSLKDLDKALKDHKDAATIDIYINSTGGDVFDGVAMYNVLKRHKAYKRVHIDGFACSIASVIAMCGNQIIMPKSSMLMIHNPWTYAMGNAKELRKLADDLDKINETIKNAYRSKINISDEDLTNLMDAESYLSADECLEKGFCTKVIDDNEDVEPNVEQALDQMTYVFQNKLDTLNAISKCIKDIENDVEPTENGEAETGEAKAIEPVEEQVEEPKEVEEAKPEEAIEPKEEGIENTVQEQVVQDKENAFMRFFNLTEEN